MSMATIFLFGLMMVVLLGFSSQVHAAQEGDFTYTVTDGQAQVTQYTGNSGDGDIIIPSTLGGAPVTSIGYQVFHICPAGLTSISLPEGLTSIGGWAFSGCTNLTSISLPESLTSIGSRAFNGCAGLMSISLPKGLTSIGSDAFCGCTGLTSISLPEGLTSIGVGAFYGCTGLTSISVAADNANYLSIGGVLYNKAGTVLIVCPGGLSSINIAKSVTSIGNSAFSGCTNLTSVSLPEGLTSIDVLAFCYCRGLTSISLPESLISIGNLAFSGCTNLMSISLPEGLTSIDTAAFGNCGGLTSIRFNSATTVISGCLEIPVTTTIIGYDPSNAKDYAASYGNPFQLIGDALSTTVPSNAQVIAVKDYDTKQPINGVSVSIGGKNVTTDSSGLATFENPASGNQLLSMASQGYCDYQTNLKVTLGKAEVFYLRKDTEPTNPHVSMINLNDGSSYYDLFKQDKAYTARTSEAGLTDKDYATMTMKANWKGKTPQKYSLSQNGKTLMESTTGTFDKKAIGLLFKPGYKIYAMAETTDGTVSNAIETGIQITSASTSFGVSDGGSGELRLGGSLGATIPGSLPVLGGTKIDFGMDVIPATITVTPDSFKIAVGVTDLADSPENWLKFKKTISDAKDTANRYKHLSNFKKMFGSKAIGMPIKSGWEPQADVVGYIEGTIVDGQPVVTKSTIILSAGASYSQQTQYIVGPVPVYLEVGGGLNMELMGEIARVVPESGELKLNTELTITPSFELGGGVGVANVVTVGAAGKAELAFLTRYTDDYQKLSLTGSMCIKAKALFFEAKKEIARGTWTIAEKLGNQSIMAASESDSRMETFNIYDASQYSLMPRDYAQNPTSWNGEPSLSTQSTDYTNQNLNVLQTNLFPNAQPKMASIGDQGVMVWIADNTQRSSANRTMLVYSVYNQTTHAWSAPVAVSDDATADFYPQTASDGNALYVTWQNSKTTFSDAVTLTEAAKAGEITVAKFNTVTRTFDAPTTLTSNETLDTQPQVAVSGEKACVAWTSNSTNDLFGTTGRNTINYAELSGASWSTPQALVSDQNAITALSLGYAENAWTAAFTVDEDNDLNTITDRDLFTAQKSQSVNRLTDDETLDSNPVFAQFNGINTLFWYQNGNIAYVPAASPGATPATVFAESRQGFGDTFSIVNNPDGKTAVIWTETKDETTEIHGAIYEVANGAWSDDIQISNVGNKVQFPNGVFDQAGNFTIAFNRLTTKEDLSQQSDLCVLGVVPSYNLTVNAVSFNDEDIIPNTALPIEIDVTNNGQLPVDQITVDVSDGETNNTSITLSESIKPGETKTLGATISLPETITKKDYIIGIKPTAGDEYDVNDNTRTITIGYTDLNLTIEKNNIGETASVTVELTNTSYVPTNASIRVTEDTIDGTVLFTKDVTNVVHGVNTFSIFELDPKALTFSGDIKQIYVSVTASGEEASTGDNSDFIVLDNPAQTEATLQSIAVTTPAAKLSYKIGEQLDLSGLVVTGAYSDGNTKTETITADTVTGFDSSKVTADQVLTITVNGKTATYTVQIIDQTVVGDVDGSGQVQAYDALMALQIATGKKVGTTQEIKAADVGNSGEVEAFDALRILQYATGKITEF